MSSNIRQATPTDRSTSTHKMREQAEQEEAARASQLRENASLATDGHITGQATVRLNQLVDRATQSTTQTDSGKATSTIGAAGAAPLNRTNAVDELAGHQQVHGTAETRLAPASAPRVQYTERTRVGAESFAANLNTALDKALVYARGQSTNVAAGGVRALSTTAEGETTRASRLTGGSTTSATTGNSLAGMGPDQLLAQFLKLNINDPNENVETHDKLYAVYTQLRQQGIEDAKKQSENAQKMKKEAEAYAKQAEVIGMVVTVISLVLTVCTFGAAAPLAAAAVAGTQAATVAATTVAQQAIAQASTQAVQTAVKAAVQNAVQQAVQATTQEAMKTAIQTAAKEAASNLVKNVSQQALQTVIDAAAKEGVQMSVQTATDTVINQMANQLMGQVATEMSAQLAASGASAATQSLATSAGQSLASDIAAQSATTGVQGAVNTTRQFGTELAKQMGNNGMRAVTVGNAALQGVSAGANYTAANKASDAREAGLGVTRARVRADAAQEGVQQEGDVINTIMEHKNQTIDAVMQMTNATWSSRQQLMAASVAR